MLDCAVLWGDMGTVKDFTKDLRELHESLKEKERVPKEGTWVNKALAASVAKISREAVVYMVGRDVVRHRRTKHGMEVLLDDVLRETRKEAKAVEAATERKPRHVQKAWGKPGTHVDLVYTALKAQPNIPMSSSEVCKFTGLTPLQVSGAIVRLRNHHNMGRYVQKMGRGFFVYRTVSEEKLETMTKERLESPPATNGHDKPSKKDVTITLSDGPMIFEEIAKLPDGRILVKDVNGIAYWLTRA